MSLRTKLLSSILLVTLAAWAFAAFRSYQDTRAEVDRLFDAHLMESATALLKQATHERRKMGQMDDDDHDGKKNHHGRRKHDDDHDDDEDDDDDERSERGIAKLHKRPELFANRLIFEFWDASGRLLLRSGKELKRVQAEEGFSNFDEGSVHLRVFSRWNADRSLRVVIAESLDARLVIARASVSHVLQPILWMIVPLILLLAGIIEWTLRPIRRLSADVGRRTVNDLTPIHEAKVPGELRPMIRALNALFGRLSRAIENERRFTADAAHELRTPLAAIKVQAQVASREKDETARARALEATVAGVDRATHLVEQLLILARLDPESTIPEGRTPLRALLTHVLQEIAPAAVAKSLEIELAEGPERVVKGQRSMLEILARNLLDNAMRYTPSGGKVLASVEQTTDGTRLVVEDTGPGLNDQQMQLIGQRFSRIHRPSGEGSGLGLSIVMKIAAIHHATVDFENKTGGAGLIVKVSFPGT